MEKPRKPYIGFDGVRLGQLAVGIVWGHGGESMVEAVRNAIRLSANEHGRRTVILHVDQDSGDLGLDVAAAPTARRRRAP